MRGPQLEDGYTRIANTLLEVICQTKFNATQLKILLLIIRYTYGFNRKYHDLSLSFIVSATGISKRYISSELKKLIRDRVVLVYEAHTDTSSRKIGLNKNYTEWRVGSNIPQVNNSSTVEQNQDTTVEQSFNTTVEQSFYQERQYKDNLKERVVEGVPSPKTNLGKVPSHCQKEDPVLVFLNQVSSYYTTLTNRLPSSNDHIAITDIANLTVDFELVKGAMDESKQNFKPKYDGDEIRSFKYFIPAIKTRVAAEQVKKEGGKADGPAPSNAAEYFKKNKNKFLYKAE